MKMFLRAGLAVMVLLFATAGYADITVCQESNGDGCVASLFTAFPNYIVASDGEASFDPFGAGYDTSDGVNFSNVGFTWQLDPSSTSWVDLGHQIFVLPANLGPCGSENEPICEPVGLFVSPGAPWNTGVITLGNYVILDAAGGVSDVITLWNANGNAYMSFASDPIAAPEPGSLVLLGTGLIGVAGTIRRKLIG